MFEEEFRGEWSWPEEVIGREPSPSVRHHDQIQMIESLRGVVEKIVLGIMNIPFEVGREQEVGADVLLEGVRFDGMGIGYTDRKAPGERFAVLGQREINPYSLSGCIFGFVGMARDERSLSGFVDIDQPFGSRMPEVVDQ